MTAFIQEYHLFFMTVLLSLSMLILLRSILGILAQVAFTAAVLFISTTDIIWIINILFAVQIVIALFLMYRVKKAIEYNYQIVLEKTRLADRHYTNSGYSGSKKSFFW